MRAAVLHVNTATRDSTSPTMRIARFVAEELGIPLIHDERSAQKQLSALAPLDVLFVKYGVLKFSRHRDDAVRLHEEAKRIINLENDYTFGRPDKRFRESDEVWSTVEGRTRLVNWNVLTRHPVKMWKKARQMPEPVHSGLIYYGAHREDRVPSFEKYFRDPVYPLTVSTYRGHKKFREYGIADVRGALRHPDEQAQWQATLYIEDETSHGLYCSPATRFYECVMAGLAQYVDRAAVPTLEKAGVPVTEDSVVNDQSSLTKALHNWRRVQAWQRDRWFRDYGEDLRKQLRAAVRASKLEL